MTARLGHAGLMFGDSGGGGSGFDAYMLTRGCLFYIPMTETSGTTLADATGNGYNFTATANVSGHTVATGSPDNSTAVDADGSLYAASASVGTSGENSFSFMLILQVDPADTVTTSDRWFTRDPTSPRGFQIFGQTANRISFQAIGRGGSAISDVGNPINTGSPRLVHCVADAGTGQFRIYIDGVEQAGIGAYTSTSAQGGTVPYYIQAYRGSTIASHGAVRGVAYWPSVRSAAQIAADYAAWSGA